jgi:ABC-type branched-subunit amino acid transport system permease subunit
MRRLRLAAAAILAGAVVVAVLGGAAIAAPVGLAQGFPATRIKLDPASISLNMPGPTTLTATVVDWHGVGSRNITVAFTNVTDP